MADFFYLGVLFRIEDRIEESQNLRVKYSHILRILAMYTVKKQNRQLLDILACNSADKSSFETDGKLREILTKTSRSC